MKKLTNQKNEALAFLRTVTRDEDKADAIMAEASPHEIKIYAASWRSHIAEMLNARMAERRLQEGKA